MAGLLPGTCDMDLVREVKSPSCCTLVLLADLLQVPPSHAFALDCDRSICGFSRILVSDLTLPLAAAALPAPPTTDEVPALPVAAIITGTMLVISETAQSVVQVDLARAAQPFRAAPAAQRSVRCRITNGTAAGRSPASRAAPTGGAAIAR